MLTHSDEPLTWEHSQKVSGDTADAIAELKRSEGRDLLIQGSSTIYPALLAAGLIDRLVLMTFPVMLGEGKRIFDGSQNGALKLVDHFVSDSGVVFTTWESGKSDSRRVDPRTGKVLKRVEMPSGVDVSGLESDGDEQFFCGGAKSRKVRTVRRPK